MKKIKLAAVVLALSLLLAGCSAAGGSSLPGGAVQSAASGSGSAAQPVSLGEFSAESLSGETLDQTVFAGHKLTVINVWATFCGPCKEEMPILAKMDNNWGDDVQVLGVVTDVVDQKGNPDEAQIQLAKDMVSEAGVEYQNLVLNESLAALGFAGFQAVPATVFVDAEGNLVGQGFYGALDEDGWQEEIEKRLAQVEAVQ